MDDKRILQWRTAQPGSPVQGTSWNQALEAKQASLRLQTQTHAGYFFDKVTERRQGRDLIVTVQNPVLLFKQYHEPPEDGGRYYQTSGRDFMAPAYYVVERSLARAVESLIVQPITNSARDLNKHIVQAGSAKDTASSKFVLGYEDKEIGTIAYQCGVHESRGSSLELTVHDNAPNFGRLAVARHEPQYGLIERALILISPLKGQEYLARLFMRAVQQKFQPDSEHHIQKLR